MKCTCGDEEELHVDNCEQCVVPECGCKEFESEEPTKESMNLTTMEERFDKEFGQYGTQNPKFLDALETEVKFRLEIKQWIRQELARQEEEWVKDMNEFEEQIKSEICKDCLNKLYPNQ